MNRFANFFVRLIYPAAFIFSFSLASYVPEDEIKNITITSGDQIIIDFFK